MMVSDLDITTIESPGAHGQSAPGFVIRIFNGLNNVVAIICCLALVLASAVLSYSVFARYFLRVPTDWQDDLSVFLIVGAVFMSAATVQVHRGHIGIEAITSLLPPRANAIRQLIVDMASALFCSFFAWKSWTLFYEAASEGYRSSSTWEAPLWIPYLVMAVGMSLLSMQIFIQVVTAFAYGKRAL